MTPSVPARESVAATMSAAENPILQPNLDPSRQLPPGELSSKVAAIAGSVGRTQAEVEEFFTSIYRSSCDAATYFAQEIRARSRKVKEENPLALLAGIGGAAFAVGVATRIWRSKK